MKRQEFIKSVKLARDFSIPVPAYLSEDMAVFHGCALDKIRRIATIAQFAGLIRGECATFSGTWLDSELHQLEVLSKRIDLI